MLECCSVNQAMFRSSRKILDGSFGLRSNLAWYFWHRHHFQLKIWHQKVLTQYLWCGLMFVIFLTPKSFDTIPVVWVDVSGQVLSWIRAFWLLPRVWARLVVHLPCKWWGVDDERCNVVDYHWLAGFLTGSRLASLFNVVSVHIWISTHYPDNGETGCNTQIALW